MKINKGIRPASGMGSSGASAAGGAYAANLLLEKPLNMNQLICCASYGEEASSGSRHADNAAPALMGGFTVIRSYEPMDVVRLTPPKDLGIVACLPEFAVPTREARKKVPKTVPMHDVIHQVGCTLHAGGGNGHREGLGLIARSINDIIVEPARAPLVPFLKEAERKPRWTPGPSPPSSAAPGRCIAAFYDKTKADGTDHRQKRSGFYEGHGVECSAGTPPGYGCEEVEQ